ncbi:MAG: serine/threonine-protein phosphatase [Spirochaetes bacterium]|nr:serine/threonine-protein phosphatase [Spirochaetota bacterium]
MTPGKSIASSPIHGIAERYVYKPVFGFYVRLVKFFSLGAMLVCVTLPVFPLLNYYAFLFLAGLEPGDARAVYRVELDAFWPGFAAVLALYAVLGGAFTRIFIPGVIPALRRLEPAIRQFTGEFSGDELRQMLRYLARLPWAFTVLAGSVFTAHSLFIYAQSYAVRGEFIRVRLFMLVDAVILVMLAGLVYSITEFCCSYLRMQVKRQLAAIDETANDLISGRSGILRFVYLLFIGATSTTALIVFMHNKSEHVLWAAVQFSAITFAIVGTLAFIYFYTWTYSLRQISDATYNVAMGGRGNLPMLSNDREMVELAVNFDAATYEINTIRNYLTELVDEKTKTISEAYNELKQLKSRQDGDYYLTSNLIESLTEIRPESETVIVDSLIKQFKIFEFMGHSKEIGGDMNAGYSLRLQGEKYTLVVNADAMGKSLQGAGGVLVLGSALRSLIERTNITEGLRNLSPERWLKNSFLELHRLFSNFNGSMMASMVCLLIHDNSGYTVMINAEHPQGILLRDGQSEFISSHEGLRKLGNNAVKGRLWVDTLMLRHRDVVILGSDGRDDIVVSYDADGQPMMNEDDRKILQIVRIAEGDLPRIFLGLRSSGEIVDDVSFVRIEYRGDQKPPEGQAVENFWESYRKATHTGSKLEALRKILDVNPQSVRAWRALLLLHLKSKNLVDAASIAESLVRIQPHRDFYMFVAGLLFYRIGQMERALNFADRLTLRNWSAERYLILLGRIHESRADEFGMREAGMLLLELLPEHAYGKKLLSGLS